MLTPLHYCCCFSRSDNSAFLNDLAAKMAAGPPKKPVGLVKKPAREATSLSLPTEPSEAEKKLGGILKATVGSVVDNSAEQQQDKEQQ